jgi:hypothetical protein
MLAYVIERLNAPVFLPDHQNFFGPDFFHLPVTWLWQFSFPAKKQPDLGPHAIPFLLKKLF